ncbi:ATP-binding protein [Cohnella soli]|uniref:histidine kinase n=1 Tax=Cohnella soli TaxID=425005 RepID=A0ABW0HTQ4_9BACL
MVFVFVIYSLLFIAVFYIFFQTRQESTRWLIATIAAGWSGILAYTIDSKINKDAEWSIQPAWLDQLLRIADEKLYAAAGYVVYAFLMYAGVYGGFFGRKTKLALAFLLPLPILLLYKTPRQGVYFEAYTAVTSAYTLIASFLLAFGAIRERNAKKRRERIMTAGVLVPPLLVAVVTRVFSKQMEFNHFLSYYVAPILGSVLFLFLAFRYGALDVKLMLRKQSVSDKFSGIASGAMIMNHAIKNHVTNIHLVALGMNKEPASSRESEDLNVIVGETRHIMTIVGRIQHQLEDVRLEKELCDLSQMIENTISANQRILDAKEISIARQYPASVTAWCDKTHMQEVLYNIIHNAIDAIGDRNGMIQIRIEEKRRRTQIEISDNGHGIAKADLDNIFNPFFSTKPGSEHYGLGLSYCYLVMKKHGGSISAFSLKGTGTTFTLSLPRRKTRFG